MNSITSNRALSRPTPTYQAHQHQSYKHIQIISKDWKTSNVTAEKAREETPVFQNPSYTVLATSSAEGSTTVPDGINGPLGSSFADRARAAEIASRNERLGHELKEGEAPPTSGSASLSGYIKLKRNKNLKSTKTSELAEMNGMSLQNVTNFVHYSQLLIGSRFKPI